MFADLFAYVNLLFAQFAPDGEKMPIVMFSYCKSRGISLVARASLCYPVPAWGCGASGKNFLIYLSRSEGIPMLPGPRMGRWGLR